MARAKGGARKAAAPAGPAGPRKMVAGIRGSEPFADWLDRFARFKRVNHATLLEHALIAYAKAQGFDEEPPER